MIDETKTEMVNVKELAPGDTIVGHYGGLSIIDDFVLESSSLRGFALAYTEHGSLYLDPDLEVKILVT